MKTRKVTAYGGRGIDALAFTEEDVAAPGAGEALVRMTAATLNYRDIIGIYGKIPGMTREPDYVPLSCACGVVESIGDGVTRVAVGDRVVPLFDQLWFTGGQDKVTYQHLGGSLDGVARDYALFSEQGLSLAPRTISDLEAATLPCAALTAWSSLFDVRATAPGDTVVVQGTGGVSIAALQFAKAAGATVILTSSSDAKLARARALGADHLVNYRKTPKWGEAVKAITGGRGADVVVDVVGTGELEQTLASLKPDGLIVGVGMLDGSFTWAEELPVPFARVNVGNREQMEAMVQAIDANAIRPVVDRVFPFEKLADACRVMESGDFFGKIGIVFD